jgi:hypothetical protein
MKAVGRVALVLAMSLKGWTSLAQATASVPPLTLAYQLRIDRTTTARNLSIAEAEKPSPSTDFFATAPSSQPERTADSEFLLLNTVHLGMAVFDVEMSERCISNHRCREINPLMSSSHAAQLSLNLTYIAASAGISYRLKEGGSKLWRIPPITGAMIHSVGIVTGFQHQ